MNAAERLYDQYQRELKRLQETCPHKELSEWVEEWWALGHSTGRTVKTCTNCNKVIQAKRRCCVCHEEYLEHELQEGDGKCLPVGARYCENCFRSELSKRASGHV